MNKILKKMMILSVAVAAPLSAQAGFSCGVQPSCAELGFVHSAERCKNLLRLKCPFGDAYFCSKAAACDYTAGAYDVQPTGSTGSSSNGCFYPTGCDEDGGYVSSQNFASSFFTNTGTLYTFTIGHGEGEASCYQVTGCKNSVPYNTWVDENYASWFTIEDIYEVGDYKCVRVDTCASGKDSADDCHEHTQSISNSKTVNGITCGTCVEEENCDQYTDGTSTKWIVSQSTTFNHSDNIEECRSLYGSSYYPTTTTAVCGGTTYRKCEIGSVTCHDLDSDYSNEVPVSTGGLYNFYEKVTNFQGSGLTCYEKETAHSWTELGIWGTSSLLVANCTVISNKDSYDVEAFYVGEAISADQQSEACRVARENLGYTKSIIANGFNFDTADNRLCQNSQTFYEHFEEALCTFTKNGKTYEAHINASSNNSDFKKIAVILSTNSNNNITFRAQPLEVYECCQNEAYNLNDIPGCSPYEFELDGNSIRVWSSGGANLGTVPGCGDYDN